MCSPAPFDGTAGVPTASIPVRVEWSDGDAGATGVADPAGMRVLAVADGSWGMALKCHLSTAVGVCEVYRGELCARRADGGAWVLPPSSREPAFAVKRFRKGSRHTLTLAPSPTVLPLLEWELHAVAGRHECLTPLLAVLEEGDSWWMVFPLAGGGDMYDAVATHTGPRDEAVARRCVFDMLRGLSHLHAAGIAHLDVSMENVVRMPAAPTSTSPTAGAGTAAGDAAGAMVHQLIDLGLARRVERDPRTGKAIKMRLPSGAC
jgi:hypothetical protein